MKDLVSNQIVRYLEARDVEHIFGLCGHTNIALLAALEKSERISFVNVRHEQIAAHAADGYARVTGRAGVVLTHLGPGLTNATTGVANAALDSIPMVVIAGDVPTPLLRQAPAPGDQPPRRCRPVGDLPAVRQARVARRPAAPHRRGARQGVHPRRERPARTRARRRADGRVLGRDRRRAVRQGAQQHALAREAQHRRRGRRADRAQPARRRPAGALRRWRDRRRGRGSRAQGVRRAPVAARRAQPHGQGRTPRRQPSGAGDDGLLGHGLRQRDHPDRGLDPRARHPVRRGRLELVVPRVHVRHPGHEAHADRHRSRRARAELPARDRRARGPQGCADRAHPGRPPLGSVGSRSATSCSRRSPRTARR